MSLLANLMTELWQILLELAPSLLAGLLIAGLIHAFLPAGVIRRGLSRPDVHSVVRASLVGVPLPLCSCGVIPTALGLRRAGASPGAATAFMISTPQTGVDSILVTAAFLGWPFALFKLAAAFVTGVIGGVLANRVDPGNPASQNEPCATTPRIEVGGPWVKRIAEAFRYAIFDLLGAIYLWLVVGVLAAAVVSAITPADFFADRIWADGLLGMLVMLAIALPLYVCTTASVPIAASLIAAGLPAGSALVFLMAGPATNLATIGAVLRTLGARVLGVYLGTVVVMSLGFGLLFEHLLPSVATQPLVHAHQHGWVSILSALVLVALIALLIARQVRARAAPGKPSEGENARLAEERDALTLQVEGMSCGHCVATVKQALESIDQVSQATPELASGRVHIRAQDVDTKTLERAIEAAGFQIARPADTASAE
jgi:uncharacterized membrane protein YraQ (UPF0718 family)/copper chaperone CopZ